MTPVLWPVSTIAPSDDHTRRSSPSTSFTQIVFTKPFLSASSTISHSPSIWARHALKGLSTKSLS